ncbi:uncharacterized protein [Anabrus simplex]|uniref:uncharacterized protein n=1 Tax=Anabrus simplex TaxID=316456 RepID=UPI0035A3A271
MPHLRRCVAPGCQEYADSLKTTALFRFPKDSARCRTWVQNSGNRELLQLPAKKLYDIRYLCGKHFEPQHFFDKFRRRLHRSAVPTIFSGNAISAEEMLVFDRMAYECVDAGQGSPVNSGKQSPRGIEPFIGVDSSTSGSSSMIQSQQGYLSSVVDPSLIDVEHCYQRRLPTESTEKLFNEVVSSPPGPSNLQKKLQGKYS